MTMNCTFGHERECRFVDGPFVGQSRRLRVDPVIRMMPPSQSILGVLLGKELPPKAVFYAFDGLENERARYRLMTDFEWYLTQREQYFFVHKEWPTW